MGESSNQIREYGDLTIKSRDLTLFGQETL